MDEDYKFLGERLNGVEQALVWHRDTTNKAIGYLNQEVVEYRNRLDRDDAHREERQRQFDEKIAAIQARIDAALLNIQRIVRRVVIAAVSIIVLGVVAAAFLIGRSL